MSKRTVKTSHSAIFNYWKDKAITPDGEIILDADISKNGISVVEDWTRPCCFACCDLMQNICGDEKYLDCIENDISAIWNFVKVKNTLNRCHIIPHAGGGEDKPENLFLLCETCHIESPDTDNPKNFFKWVYKRRKRGLTIKGFIISEFVNEFLQDCKEKGKNPLTLKPNEAKVFSHNGKISESTAVMALSDTCDNL